MKYIRYIACKDAIGNHIIIDHFTGLVYERSKSRRKALERSLTLNKQYEKTKKRI